MKSHAIGKVALLLISFGLSVGISEWILRSIEPSRPGRAPPKGHTTLHRQSADPELVYEMAPGGSTTMWGVSIRINDDGFRGRDVDSARAGPRVLVLGDSVTFGHGVADADLFTSRLEAELVPEWPGIMVLNRGVTGYSTAQELRLLETRGLAERPDLVIVAYVLNDPDIADGGLATHFGYRSEWEVVRHLRAAYRHVARRLTSQPERYEYHNRVHAANWPKIEANFQRLTDLGRANGFAVWLVLVPVLELWDEYPWIALHAEVRKRAEAAGMKVLDARDAFAGKRPEDLRLDAWHPNVEGHRLLASLISDEMRRDRSWLPAEVESPNARTQGAAE